MVFTRMPEWVLKPEICEEPENQNGRAEFFWVWIKLALQSKTIPVISPVPQTGAARRLYIKYLHQ